MWRDSDLDSLSLFQIVELAFAYRILRSFEWSADGLILRVFTDHAMPLLTPAEARIYLVNCLTAIPPRDRTVWLDDGTPDSASIDDSTDPE